MNLLSPVISEPGNYFSIFYQLAFLIPFILLLLVGIRKKYDMASWLVIMLSSAFFFLLGTRILTFTPAEWKVLLTSGNFPESYNKFALGGLLLALPMIELSRRFLRFQRPVLSVFAWIVPIGLAIQKIGCLMSGCCYGIPTRLPWGIKYAAGMPPYLAQVKTGLINEASTVSHAIHPTQVYQLLIYLIISAVVIKTIRKGWSERRTVLLSIVLLLSGRFLLEFLVDSNANTFGASILLGMKVIQWCCLIAVSLLAIILAKTREKQHSYKRVSSENIPLTRPLIVIIWLTFLFILVHKAFSSIEIIAFNIRFLLITALLATVVFFRITIQRFRLASALILLLPLFLLSQTVEKTPYEKSKYLSIGSSFGRYLNDIRYNPHTGCSDNIIYDRVKYNNSKFGLQGEYTFTGIYGYSKYRYGSYFTAGYLEEDKLETNARKGIGFFYASPFAEINERWFGAGGQLHLGYLPYLRISPVDDFLPPENNYSISPVLPGAMIRLGPYDILYLRYDYNYLSTMALPYNYSSLSLGTSFGSRRSSGIRTGLMLSRDESFFVESDLWLNDNFGIWAGYYSTRAYLDDMIYSNFFSLGIRTRLKN